MTGRATKKRARAGENNRLMPIKEIAARLDVCPETVQKTMERAIKKLKAAGMYDTLLLIVRIAEAKEPAHQTVDCNFDYSVTVSR